MEQNPFRVQKPTSLTEVHDALNEMQCLCRLDQDSIAALLDISKIHDIVLDAASTSRESREWRDEVLLKLGIITSIAEADYCAALRKIHQVFAVEQTLEKIWTMVGCGDQLVAYSACKCVKALLLALVETGEAQVQNFLQCAIKAIGNINQRTRPEDPSVINKVVFTFDLFADLFHTQRSDVGRREKHRLPCLSSASSSLGDGFQGEQQASDDQQETPPDVAEICCSACQESIADLTVIFSAHLGVQDTNLDVPQWKGFHSWLQSLDKVSSSKVSYSFFRLLFALTKYLNSHGKPLEFFSHVHSIVPLLVSLLKSYCRGNVAILKVVLDILNLCVHCCAKEGTPTVEEDRNSTRGTTPSVEANTNSDDLRRLKVELSRAVQNAVTEIVQTTWLEGVSYHEGPVGFGGTDFMGSDETKTRCSGNDSGNGDGTLLRKLANFIILSFEHVSMSSAEHPHLLLLECVQALSTFVMTKLNMSANCNEDSCKVEWLFLLFGDQDDALIGTMLSLLKTSLTIHKSSCCRQTHSSTVFRNTARQDEIVAKREALHQQTERTVVSNSEFKTKFASVGNNKEGDLTSKEASQEDIDVEDTTLDPTSLLKTSMSIHKQSCHQSDPMDSFRLAEEGSDVGNISEGHSCSKEEEHKKEADEIMRTNSILNPHCVFLSFLHHMTWDHSILLDHLISMETDFLEYLVRYLRFVPSDWAEFIDAHRRQQRNISDEDLEDSREHAFATNLIETESIVNITETDSDRQDSCDSSHKDIDEDNDKGRDDRHGDDNDDDDDDDDDEAEDEEEVDDNVHDDDGTLRGDDFTQYSFESVDSKCNVVQEEDRSSQKLVCESRTEESTLKRRHADLNEKDVENQMKFSKLANQNVENNLVEPKEEIVDLDFVCSLPDELPSLNEDKSDERVGSPSGAVIALLDDTMTVLIRLQLAIERLHKKNLFPFSAKPLLRLLTRIEDLYEN